MAQVISLAREAAAPVCLVTREQRVCRVQIVRGVRGMFSYEEKQVRTLDLRCRQQARSATREINSTVRVDVSGNSGGGWFQRLETHQSGCTDKIGSLSLISLVTQTFPLRNWQNSVYILPVLYCFC